LYTYKKNHSLPVDAMVKKISNQLTTLILNFINKKLDGIGIKKVVHKLSL
jgi:hypothetical protein